jgi:hypothetical protein
MKLLLFKIVVLTQMTATFDTYTHRPLIYKIMQAPAVLLVIAITMCSFNINSFVALFKVVFIFCLFFGLVGFVVRLIWWSIPAYVKDGELLFEDDRVTLKGSVFLLSDLKMIEIDCYNYAGYRGRSRNDGTGNRILITTKNSEIIEHKFVISSVKKWNNLGVIMKGWKQDGFKIVSNGIDLI